MKVVVVGNKFTDTLQLTQKNAGNTIAYVSDIEDAMDAVIETGADILVLEGEATVPGSLIALRQRLPHHVQLLMMTNVQPYFMIVDNSFKTTINHFIPDAANLKNEKRNIAALNR
jgi:prephenate dehydratase